MILISGSCTGPSPVRVQRSQCPISKGVDSPWSPVQFRSCFRWSGLLLGTSPGIPGIIYTICYHGWKFSYFTNWWIIHGQDTLINISSRDCISMEFRSSQAISKVSHINESFIQIINLQLSHCQKLSHMRKSQEQNYFRIRLEKLASNREIQIGHPISRF